jgi:hypothetical protein
MSKTETMGIFQLKKPAEQNSKRSFNQSEMIK